MEHIDSLGKFKHSTLHSTLYFIVLVPVPKFLPASLFHFFPSIFLYTAVPWYHGRFIQEPLCMPKSVDAHVSYIKWQGTRNTVSALYPWALHPRSWRANHSIFDNTLGLVSSISVCLRKKMKYVCVCACMCLCLCVCVCVCVCIGDVGGILEMLELKIVKLLK